LKPVLSVASPIAGLAKSVKKKLQAMEQSAFDALRARIEKGCENTPKVAWGNLSSWMQKRASMIHDVPLLQLVLPGTHDSGAYQLYPEKASAASKQTTAAISKMNQVLSSQQTKSLEVAVERTWAVAQTKTVFQQLEGGIRYLDLRVSLATDSQWIVHHGDIPGNKLQTILHDVVKFLAHNKGEIVVMEFSDVKAFTQQEVRALAESEKLSLFSIIKTTFGSQLAAAKGISNLTVGKLVDRNTRAVAGFTGLQTNDPLLWDNFFVNDYANTPDLNTMSSHNTALLVKLAGQRTANANKVTKLSWTLTPNEGSIMESLQTCGSSKKPRNLLALAAQANGAFPKWLSTAKTHASGVQGVKTILFDNPTLTAIEDVIKCNAAH